MLIADILFNGKMVKGFPIRSGVRQGSPLITATVQHDMGILVRTISPEKEKTSKLERKK